VCVCVYVCVCMYACVILPDDPLAEESNTLCTPTNRCCDTIPGKPAPSASLTDTAPYMPRKSLYGGSEERRRGKGGEELSRFGNTPLPLIFCLSPPPNALLPPLSLCTPQPLPPSLVLIEILQLPLYTKHINTHAHAHTYAHTCTHTHTHVRAHTHIHTHSHTLTSHHTRRLTCHLAFYDP